MWNIWHSDGSLLPASEMTLMLFVFYLVEFCSQASAKVYLYGVRSMHIEAGFPNLLLDKLCLYRVFLGIKQCKGKPHPIRLPITLKIWMLSTCLFTWIVMMTLCSGQLVVWDSLVFSAVLNLQSKDALTLKYISPLVIVLWTIPFTPTHYSFSSRPPRQTLSGRACL